MIYKVSLMGRKDIVIPTKTEISKIYEAMDKGAKWVDTTRGLITIASISGITAHHEMNEEVKERMKYGETLERAERTVLKSFSEAHPLEEQMVIGSPETDEEKKNRKRFEEVKGKNNFGQIMDGSPAHD